MQDLDIMRIEHVELSAQAACAAAELRTGETRARQDADPSVRDGHPMVLVDAEDLYELCQAARWRLDALKAAVLCEDSSDYITGMIEEAGRVGLTTDGKTLNDG